jgi:hypothetical protein
MWQVGGFLWLLRFPPPTKLIAEILLKVALNTITLTPCVFILKCVYSNNVGFTTTYDISAISWQSVLLVEETGGPGENH